MLLLYLVHSFITKSGVFLFGNGKLRTICKRYFETAYIIYMIGIYEITLMTFQKKMSVFFLNSRYR